MLRLTQPEFIYSVRFKHITFIIKINLVFHAREKLPNKTMKLTVI